MSEPSDESLPSRLPGNPGEVSRGQTGFADAQGTWSESFDVVETAAQALEAEGHEIIRRGDVLEHPAGGFFLIPGLVHLVPLDGRRGVRTCSTMQVHHTTLVPGGLFEYQHETGDTIAESLAKGFRQWAKVDYFTLLEATRAEPQACMCLVIDSPPEGDRPARRRRVVLGPVAHLKMETPPPPGKPSRTLPGFLKALLGRSEKPGRDEPPPDEHPFCSCCLFTRSGEAMKDLINSDQTFGIRLFASLDGEGNPMADCRVNGEDYEPGVEALRDYAQGWHFTGFELRKQYVIIQSLPAEFSGEG